MCACVCVCARKRVYMCVCLSVRACIRVWCTYICCKYTYVLVTCTYTTLCSVQCWHVVLASSGCVPPFSLDRVIFPTRRKEVSDDEIVHKTFIISSGSFAFGPLHCGRPRERLDVARAQNWGACVCHVGSIDLKALSLNGKGFFYTKNGMKTVLTFPTSLRASSYGAGTEEPFTVHTTAS